MHPYMYARFHSIFTLDFEAFSASGTSGSNFSHPPHPSPQSRLIPVPSEKPILPQIYFVFILFIYYLPLSVNEALTSTMPYLDGSAQRGSAKANEPPTVALTLVVVSSLSSIDANGSLSWVSFGNGFIKVSFRNTSHAINNEIEQTAQGRKYEYFLKNSLEPSNSGNYSAGREREPPILDPTYCKYIHACALPVLGRKWNSWYPQGCECLFRLIKSPVATHN